MTWPNIAHLQTKLSIPSGYVLDRLNRNEVPDATRLLRSWYPDIEVGAESRHLREEFYYENAFLDTSSEHNPILPIIVRHSNTIVALLTIERNFDALTVTGPLGAIAQEHRGSGLAFLGPALLELVGRELGAQLAYYFATLKIIHQQVLAERLGYTLVGIVPGFDRDMVSPGVVVRVYEALYAKLLVPKERVMAPPLSALTPNTAKLFQHLFADIILR